MTRVRCRPRQARFRLLPRRSSRTFRRSPRSVEARPSARSSAGLSARSSAESSAGSSASKDVTAVTSRDTKSPTWEKVGETVFPSVIQAFADALHGEGFASWMYLDKEKLLTTGRGNLIDTSVAGATDPMTLGWVDSSGNAASPDLVQAAINAVKARPDLVPYGGAGKSPSGESFAGLTSVRLTDATVASLVGSSASQLASALQNYLPNFNAFPADAQLAILRYAWANGPNLPVKAPLMYAALGG